jgi:biopolymer transport protein ExbD
MLISAFGNITKEKINLLTIFFSSVVIVLFFTLSIQTAVPIGVPNAKIKSYLDQMIVVFRIRYDNDGNSYIGTEKDNDYLALQKRIEDIYENRQAGNFYSAQIEEKKYCVRAKLLSREAYWCIDNKGYEGESSDQYCTAEKPYCAE